MISRLVCSLIMPRRVQAFIVFYSAALSALAMSLLIVAGQLLTFQASCNPITVFQGEKIQMGRNRAFLLDISPFIREDYLVQNPQKISLCISLLRTGLYATFGCKRV